jgi:hypothetical protein
MQSGEFGLQVRLPQTIWIAMVYQFDVRDCDARVTEKEDRANEISVTCKPTARFLDGSPGLLHDESAFPITYLLQG